MKKQLIGFKCKGKKIELEVNRVPWWNEGRGLMFKRKNSAKALLFSFRKPTRMAIHSFFVFFDFLAIWLDDKGEVIELKIIAPGKSGIKPIRKFSKLIEIPLTKNYDEVIQSLVGKTFK